MAMITYKPQSDLSIRVLLNGKVAGTIRRFGQGWQYRPRGASNGGEFFDTLEQCKRSLNAAWNRLTVMKVSKSLWMIF